MKKFLAHAILSPIYLLKYTMGFFAFVILGGFYLIFLTFTWAEDVLNDGKSAEPMNTISKPQRITFCRPDAKYVYTLPPSYDERTRYTGFRDHIYIIHPEHPAMRLYIEGTFENVLSTQPDVKQKLEHDRREY